MNRKTGIPHAQALKAALAAFAMCALAATPSIAAWTSNPAANTPICTSSDNQSVPVVVSDGQGGVFIGWNDSRNGNVDLFIQRVDARGNALWGTNGTVLCDAPDGQANLQLLADGAGGVFAAWTDLRNGGVTRDLYAQRLDAAGVAQWTPNGLPIVTVGNNQMNLRIARGAANFDELLLVWEDWRNGATDIYAQGVSGAGAIRYTADGVVVCNATGDQKRPTVVEDGVGGVIIAWQDLRSATTEDIYAQRFMLGSNLWTANGVALCTSAGNQIQPVGVSDGAGGMIVAWDDDRAGAGNHDVYGQRVDILGNKPWGTNGLAIDNNPATQGSIDICSDGSHGAYVVWVDGADIRAQRMTSGGSPTFSGGVAICTAASSQLSPRIVSDGIGGAFITWYDQRTGEADIYAARLTDSSQLWGVNGLLVGSAPLHQFYPTLAADGRGAAIVAWGDGRLGNLATAFDIYAQRIDRFGVLGEPEPKITSLVDVPGDEGGNLSLGWNASPLVTPGTVGAYSYRLWRATPVLGDGVAAGGVRMACATTRDPNEAARANGPLFAPEFSASSTAWEYVATVAADLAASYSVGVPTFNDSVPGLYLPRTRFMVELRDGPGGMSRFSLPDSARSVDNLPPAAPVPFTGEFTGSETHLRWSANHEPDFAIYLLFRGDAPGFPQTPLTFIGTLSETSYVDVTTQPYVYRIIARDVHGNGSPGVEVTPTSTVDVPGPGTTLAFLAGVAPNPSQGDVTMRFGLSRAGRASLDVFDASGRRVRELARGELTAGEHHARWDGRDSRGGSCPAGMYFVRLQTEGFQAERRFVRVR